MIRRPSLCLYTTKETDKKNEIEKRSENEKEIFSL